jgi:transposase InsO family protein
LAAVEPAINQVVSRRFVKKQQMQWTLRGAHLLLQTKGLRFVQDCTSYPIGSQVFETKRTARREIFEYIEVYYNNRRIHSALDYQTSCQFEGRDYEKKEQLSRREKDSYPSSERETQFKRANGINGG